MKQHALRAASLASLGTELLRGRLDDRSRLIERMGSLHGLPQKIAQVILSEPNILQSSPDEPSQQGSPESLDEFSRWLTERLSADARNLIATICPHGIAASIGQVHRALLKDGRAIAIKAQYPHIRESIDTDLAALGLLVYPLTAAMRSRTSLDFSLSEYRAQLRESLLEELDYRRESATIERFRKYLREIPDLVVPSTIPELSSETVIATEWFDGKPLSECKNLSADQRNAIATALVKAFLTSTFVHRELHADPHPRNILIAVKNDTPTVALIDFGATARMSEEVAYTLLRLLRREATTPSDILSDLAHIGFNQGLLEPCTDQLPEVLNILTEPFFADASFDCATWNVKNRIESVLGEYRWNFRVAGPAMLLPFIRALTGLLGNVSLLGARINWRCISEPILKAAHASNADPRLLSRSTLTTENAPTSLSSFLQIRVVKSGVPLVQLTLKAHLASELPELVPPEIIELLPGKGVNIYEIAERATLENFAPGELFSLVEGEKSYRVWLE